MRASRSRSCLGLVVERDRGETAVEAATKSGADRRFDHVEADVDEAERERGVAESAVEVGGDGHDVILLRSRRTPVDVAWRAASGLEPSADAIWSYERS